MLDLRRLSVFHEVARLGSFSAAADSLGYSQPAVSHHVARLELEVGATLLHRHPRSLELTDVGRELIRHADGILELVRSAESDLRDIVLEEPGRLRLGGFQTSTDTIIRTALTIFWQGHPNTKVSLLEADPIDHLDGLRSGELDIAIIFDSPEGPMTVDDRIDVEFFHEDPLLLALPADHPLAGRTEVPLERLRGARWLEGAGPEATSSLVLRRACEELGFEPDIAFACGNYHAVQHLVRHGMGVALLPELATGGLDAGVVVRPLAGASPIRRIGAASMRGRKRPAIHATMRTALREAFSLYREGRSATVRELSVRRVGGAMG
jgi:DNA-binding transcriptional LysR family regulator